MREDCLQQEIRFSAGLKFKERATARFQSGLTSNSLGALREDNIPPRKNMKKQVVNCLELFHDGYFFQSIMHLVTNVHQMEAYKTL